MPRHPDIGWKHGKMIGGHRHHVQCNYCHRIMIGGITRFKEHLASKRGEVKGCKAVPKEVRDMIKKHLSMLKANRMAEKKQGKMPTRVVLDPPSTNHDVDSDASDSDESNDPKSSNHQYMGGSTEFLDAFSSGSDKEVQSLAPPRATDIGWAHGSMVNGDRQKIKCRYCCKVILGGGISRLKQHLAGERGNITPCENVPNDVKAQIQQHRGFKVLQKLHKQNDVEVVKVSSQHSKEKGHKADAPVATFAQGTCGRRGKEVEEGSSSRRKRTKLFVPQFSPIPHSTPQLSFASQESKDQADIAVAKYMYHAGIPFNAANSSYFQRMADAIAAVGPGYEMPSYHSLRGKLLGRCAIEVDEICKELRKSWEVTGCTVMVDRWTNKADRTIIDIFVYCPKGTMFLKSVDASDIENSLDGLMDEVKYVLEKAKKICQFIYNNAWVLHLMRKQTQGRDIFQPAATEFRTKFLTLQNIVSLKNCLHQMVTTTIWEQSDFCGQRLGVDVTEIVLDPLFWSSSTKITKVSKALTTVLEVADNKERPFIGYLYDAMEKAKKDIITAFDNDESEYFPYLAVIDQARDEYHSPLHAAAYYLNPSSYYNPSFSITSVIQKGLLDCIETLEPNITAQDNITRDKAFYEDAVGDFSRPVAVRGRQSLVPATWWSQYASDYPDLQRFAVRILSQTCSISTHERNWAFNDCTHSIKNRFEHQRLNDLTFVHYNLGIQQSRKSVALGAKALTRGEYDPISLEGKNINVGDWIEDPRMLEEEGPFAILARKDYENLGIDDGGLDESDRIDDDLSL